MFGTKILEERRSKFNENLKVVRSFGFGTYIQADGLTQSGGVVEEIWKSTLKKVKGERREVKECLVLGLGGGTVVKLINKNWPGAKITGVDIDPEIVELGKKYLGLDEQKVKIVISDAAQYTKYNILNTKFDLIIVDLYNGDQFPKKFESKNYIHLVRSLLSREGTVVFNRLYYKDKKIEAEHFGEKLKMVFNSVESFRPVSNLMYICKI